MTDQTNTGPATMTGNVQGFDIPRGCLITAGAIALPIVICAIGLARADSFSDFILALGVPVAVVAALLFFTK